jgi:PhzF family phenazine biosynthesis protein
MKREFNVYTIDSFAKVGEVKTGNPAGFVLMADLKSIPNINTAQIDELVETALTEQEMRNIAEAVGFSETAFVSASKKADFCVRFFTPTDEVDLCGHATIGLFSGLYQLGVIKEGVYTQETKAGLLSVKIQTGGQVLMEQAAPLMGSVYSAESVAKSLGLVPSDICEELPCQAVSTGLLDVLIPVKSVETLSRIQPDDEAICNISRAWGVGGYHVFALTAESENTPQTSPLQGLFARCRNFAPIYAIPEESATGTSNGALAAYLKHYLKPVVDRYEFTQGVEMGSPSQINAEIDKDGKVWVGGTACHLGRKCVSIDSNEVDQ